ncbi:MAG: hypothetical protein NTV62_00905 [Candidatus Gribaldobacteria bacterium]|nr:hypothetical protein [Candidatus Gribaldobacteria bacterium]
MPIETAFSPNGSLKNLIRVWDNTQGNAPITEALNKTQYFETIEKQYTTLKQDIQKQTSVPNCQYIMDSTQEGHKVLNELEEFVNNEAKRQEVMQHKNNSDSQQYSFRLDREHTRGSGEMNIHLDYNILTRDKFTNLASLEKYVALENAKIQEKMEVENQRVELQVGINWENQKVEQMPTEAIRAGYRIEQEQEVTEKISSALTSLEIKTLDKGNELVRILRTRVGSPLEFTLPEDPRGTETKAE